MDSKTPASLLVAIAFAPPLVGLDMGAIRLALTKDYRFIKHPPKRRRAGNVSPASPAEEFAVDLIEYDHIIGLRGSKNAKWAPRKTVLFVVGISVALWSIIACITMELFL